MEENLLCTLLPSDELNIVDEQHVIVSILLVETEHLVVSDSIDHFICEFFRRNVS